MTESQDWVERLPDGWERMPLKRIASVTNSGIYGEETSVGMANIPLRICTTAHIDPLTGFRTQAMKYRYFSAKERDEFVGHPGDIFVVKSSGSNTNVITGKRAQIVDEVDIVFTNFLLRVRANHRCQRRFLYYLLGSSLVHERIKPEVATTTYPNLNMYQYLNEPLPVPPNQIQQSIADFLDRETARIDQLIEKKQRLMSLLAEKQSRIITMSVCGRGFKITSSTTSGTNNLSPRLRSVVRVNPSRSELAFIPPTIEVTFNGNYS